MTPDREPLLAVAAGDIVFALEPGRRYRLGSHPLCDVRLPASAPEVAAELHLDGGEVVVAPSSKRPALVLRVGESLRFGGAEPVELRVLPDDGNAILLPDPQMRAERAARAAGSEPEVAHTGATIVASDIGPAGAAPSRAVPSLAGPAALATGAPPGITPSPDIAAAAEPGPSPHRAGESFHDLMARELRRAPWFSLSLLIHAVLLLLLLWLFPAPDPGSPKTATYGYSGIRGPAETQSPPASAPEVIVEGLDTEPKLLDVDSDPVDRGDAPFEGETLAERGHSLLRIGGERVAQRRQKQHSGGGDVLDSGGGVDTGGFRDTVNELRQSGLEVVFVLDSTGSMSGCLRATKEGITQMLDVLRALVPDARFGLVTYRDHGRREDYLLRQLPLGRDFYAAANFVHSIDAEGGGDPPEAVLAGLRTAFKQPFRSGARRVIVLAGDAPPHDEELRPLLREVREFSRVRDSYVHTLVTGQSRGAENVEETFARIAESGRGVTGTVQDHERILREVLSLAFGREFGHNLEAVEARIEAERRSPPSWALHLARTGGDDLAAALAADYVPAAVVNALLRLPRRSVACELVDLLGRDRLPTPGRQATAHVLQFQLGLPTAPIDPESPRPIPPHEVARLRQLAERLP